MASRDKAVELWDAHSQRRTAELAGHEGGVRALSISIDGRTLVVGDDFPHVWVWDLVTGVCTASLTGPQPAGGHLVAGQREIGNLAAADLSQVPPAVKRKLGQTQYQPEVVDGCLVGTGLAMDA
ncbi:WD40 repeat domain-containing protein [Streptomyces sp. NPDC051286]|uniref:WD40 repeat domain-containing protein n=1 Tax=Streptomyces sp. NPDC051286 TaxID=3365647 RepID=UPI00378E8620